MKRLTPASLTFGVMAIMGLLVAAYVVRSLMAREQKEVAIATRNMPTPVADIPIGTELTEKHLGTAPIRVDQLTPDMLANKNIIVGRVVREPLMKAHPIKANQLYAPGERPQLVTTKEHRLLTLPFDGVTTIVDGLIRPGDHCDLRFTLNPSWIRSDLRTSQAFQLTLFKAIKVVAINRNIVQQVPDDNVNTVTLEVTPKQANALLLAREYGKIYLTYTQDLTPGGVDLAESDTDRLTLEKLLGLPPKKEPEQPPKPPEPHRVDAYRGLAGRVLHFNAKGRALDYYYNYNNFGTGTTNVNAVDNTVNRTVPSADMLDLGPNSSPTPATAPGTGAPNSTGPDVNGPGTIGPGANGAGNNRNGGSPTASTLGGSNPSIPGTVAPTAMASQTRYAHQVGSLSSSNPYNSGSAGSSTQGGNLNGLNSNPGPQFYGQSAPGQVTGPGYTIVPTYSPGVYGNGQYFSAQ